MQVLPAHNISNTITSKPVLYQIAGSLVHFYGRLDFHQSTDSGLTRWSIISYFLRTSSLAQRSTYQFHQQYRSVSITVEDIIFCDFVFYRVGAAISVESQKISDVFSKLLFNPLCFLRYEDPKKAPDSWEDARIATWVELLLLVSRLRFISVEIQLLRLLLR